MKRLVISWLSLLTRSSLFILTAPLLAKNYDADEVLFWYFCATLYGLVFILDLGFSPNLSRYFSYTQSQSKTRHLNTPDVSDLLKVSGTIYRSLAFLVGLFLVIIGFAFRSKIFPQPHAEHLYLWIFFILSSTFQILGIRSSTTLNGHDKVSLVQSIYFSTAIVQIVCAGIISSLSLNFSILFLAFHGGTVLQSILLNRAEKKITHSISRTKKVDKKIFKEIFETSWKSGVGMLCSIGVFQASGLYYSACFDARTATSFMLTLQLTRALGTVSQVPIYAFLPKLSREYAEGKLQEVSQFFQSRLTITLALYMLGSVFLVFIAPNALHWLNQPDFIPTSTSFYLMLIGILVERFGAAYTQLYTLSNNVIWHKVNGATCVLIVILAVPFHFLFKSNGFPLAFVFGNLMIFSWVPLRYAKRHFEGMHFRNESFFIICITILSSLLLFRYIP
ncbi:hypothetical protein [Pseudomonas citronellolis]|uniref:hypothetical protein n=1 Tax=Pseudomonas citronellolis TaxID=53408 RepID=UPI000A861F6E|nr:hypothetical protein [Pseudomonas citronellolis]